MDNFLYFQVISIISWETGDDTEKVGERNESLRRDVARNRKANGNGRSWNRPGEEEGINQKGLFCVYNQALSQSH
jgi:hypothetical protein